MFASSGASSPRATATLAAQWFVIHRAVQMTGMVFFSIGFLLPWVAFGDHHGAAEEEESFLVKVGFSPAVEQRGHRVDSLT